MLHFNNAILKIRHIYANNNRIKVNILLILSLTVISPRKGDSALKAKEFTSSKPPTKVKY